MNRSDYMSRLQDALDTGRISAEAYDSAVMNADIFCDDDEDEDETYYQLPPYYAEVEYDNFDNPEAILGSRWDDMNYTHYMER